MKPEKIIPLKKKNVFSNTNNFLNIECLLLKVTNTTILPNCFFFKYNINFKEELDILNNKWIVPIVCNNYNYFFSKTFSGRR